MLPVLFGGTCEWKWREEPMLTVKHIETVDRMKYFSLFFSFFSTPGSSHPSYYEQLSYCGGAGWLSHQLQLGYCVAQPWVKGG